MVGERVIATQLTIRSLHKKLAKILLSQKINTGI